MVCLKRKDNLQTLKPTTNRLCRLRCRVRKQYHHVTIWRDTRNRYGFYTYTQKAFNIKYKRTAMELKPQKEVYIVR